jgi:hypothetical protein
MRTKIGARVAPNAASLCEHDHRHRRELRVGSSTGSGIGCCRLDQARLSGHHPNRSHRKDAAVPGTVEQLWAIAESMIFAEPQVFSAATSGEGNRPAGGEVDRVQGL